jgi:hypothetical protein
VGLDAARTSADAEIAPIREPQSVNVMALRDVSSVLMQRLGGLRSKVLCLTWPKVRSRRLYTDTICMRYFHGDQARSRRNAGRERVENLSRTGFRRAILRAFPATNYLVDVGK